MSRQAAAEVDGLVKIELMMVGWVPVFSVMTASDATAALRPTMVQLDTRGWAKKAVPDGAADHSKPRLPLVTAVGRWVTMPNWAPPRQPVSVSRPSSSAPLMTMWLRLTVPPKISMPSSELLYDCTYSTVVPEPTPARVRACSSLPVEISKPEYLICT